jgi:hypothetical protein
LNIINFETSVITHDKLWPGKVFKYVTFFAHIIRENFYFSYRTRPANLACLTTANIHHVSLANNYTLDFGLKRLEESCESLEKSGISYVGESFWFLLFCRYSCDYF